MSDFSAAYVFALQARRLELLLAGDDWARDDEPVDLMLLWFMGRRAR